MVYTMVGYQITDSCNAKCKICCASSPQQKGSKLDLELILKSIDSLKDLGIKVIGLAGGEPFLYIDDMLAITSFASKLGFKITVTTNALWCKSYEYALDVLLQLKENGLDYCVISTDAFHEEFVPVQNVRTLIRACKATGVQPQIQTVSTKSSFEHTDRIVSELGEDKVDVQVLYGALQPAGMARHSIHLDEYFTHKLNSLVCPFPSTLFIASDGRAKPCCAPGCTDIPFDFGNVHEDSISDIIQNIQNNKLMRMITSGGFHKLLEIAKKEKGYMQLEKYVCVCHLCYDLLNDYEQFKYLEQKAEEWTVIRNSLAGWTKA